MLVPNPIIDTLSEKFKQTEEIETKYFAKRKNLYLKTIVALVMVYPLFVFLCGDIIDSELIVNIGMTTLITILILIETTLKLYDEGVDFFFLFFYADYKILTENKKQIIEYLKQEDVQAELFNFAEKHGSIINLYELKKSFAFNNHNESFRITRQLFDYLRIEHAVVETKNKEEKHIKDYELSIRMKL
jgi:hypothetical protein